MPNSIACIHGFRSAVRIAGFAAVLTLLAQEVSGQTLAWNPANGHTYLATSALMTWNDGRTLATSHGGYLAAINDAAEQAWVQTTFQAPDNLWIGLTDELQNGVFAWHNGEPLTYTNWCPGEPNGGGIDDQVELYGTSTSCPGTWNDVQSTTRRALLEIPTTFQGQPVIASVSPGFGPRTGGTPITITGANLGGVTSVNIGGAPLQSLVIVNGTTITGLTPPGNVGIKDVVACSPSGCGLTTGTFIHLPDPLPVGPLVNGSFESGPATQQTLSAGSTAITGWLVSSGDLERYPSTFWQPADGQWSLDMDGGTAGAIQQVFPTEPGHRYVVTFRMAGNTHSSGPTQKTMRVEVAGLTAIHTFDSAAFSVTNMGWSPRTLTFVAPGASATLRFTSLTPGAVGPALDDVAVVELAGPLQIGAPSTSVVGVPLAWSIATLPAAPFAAYLFDVSLDGDTPGLAVPAPLPGPIPLNPTFLHITYGLAFPQLFSGFIGLLDATGQAAPVLFTPFFAGIVGQDLYAACITFDPFGPLGIGLISNGERTTFVSPAPAVSGVVPGIGSSNGGDPVTVSGSLFLPGASVTFGGAPATSVQVVDSATITCLTPPRPGGPADVVVSNPGGVTGTLVGGFNYFFANPAPMVAGVNPPDGPIAGNSPVVVSGTGFTTGAGVTIGGAAGTNVTVLNSTTIVCQTPAGTLGPKNVVVTNADTQAGTLANGFTYIPDLSLTSVSPLVAATGAPITLLGTGFQSGLQLTVGPIIVTPTSASTTQIVFAMPAGAACSTQVTVSNPSTQTAALGFNPSPFISAAPGAVGPASGGGSFFLIGSNFFPGTTVTVGGAAATIQSLAPTAILAIAPPGSVGNAPIVVTSVPGCTATSTYLYQ